MTWRPSAMCCCTCLRVHYHGKGYLVDQRMKSITTLRRRRLKRPLKTCAEASPTNLKSLWTTVAHLSSIRSPITRPVSVFLSHAASATAWTSNLWTTPGNKTDSAKIRRHLKTLFLMLSARNPPLKLVIMSSKHLCSLKSQNKASQAVRHL